MKKGAWIDLSLWLAATELVGILSGCLAGDIRAVYQNCISRHSRHLDGAFL